MRHFAGTTPFAYQLSQMILYDMGLPLALLGLAGFAWAVSRVWRRWSDEWGIVVIFLAGYFAVVGSAYVKYTRYMLPVFAPLAVCGAVALVVFARWGTARLAAASDGESLGNGCPSQSARTTGSTATTDLRLSARAATHHAFWGALVAHRLRRASG